MQRTKEPSPWSFTLPAIIVKDRPDAEVTLSAEFFNGTFLKLNGQTAFEIDDISKVKTGLYLIKFELQEKGRGRKSAFIFFSLIVEDPPADPPELPEEEPAQLEIDSKT